MGKSTKLTKQEFADRVLQSVPMHVRPEVSPFLFTRIEERIRVVSQSYVSRPVVAFSVAVVVVLVAVNIWSLGNAAFRGANHSGYSINQINFYLYN